MRKIKLMALLLATLMIVSAFAGCAGVKKEELDALDGRVQALEDLLNGQQASLDAIKDSVNAGKDNSDVLAAIESIKKDLEEQIKDVDDKVEADVGKAPVSSITDETKAAQQKALALIEVRRAEFNKVADEYSAEDYTKISEALGTATGAVNAATTTTAVDAAMAALTAELGKYMTYAMKAYDYYTQLLGGVNADAADLVAEARAFLKEVKAVYDEKVEFTGIINENASVTNVQKDGYIAELLYLVEDKENDTKDVYIDIYGAITDLCTLYDSTAYTWAASNVKKIYIENAKGKLDWVEVYPLAAFTRRAKDLVTDIDDVVGGEITFKYKSGTTTPDFDEINTVYEDYSKYAEAALALGGEKLVALVTNADKIEAAQAQVKNLTDAADAFTKATKLGIGKTADLFYYYDVLLALGVEEKLEVTLLKDKDWDRTKGENLTTSTAGNTVNDILAAAGLEKLAKDQKDLWVADEYAKVEDLLDEWKTTYNLSDKNVLDIIKAVKGNATYYTAASTRSTVPNNTYVYDKLVNKLTVEAYNTFKSDVAPKIIAANGMGESVQLVLAVDDVADSIEALLKLQKKDKDADYPANLEINMTDVANLKVMVRDADIFADYVDDTDERLDAAFVVNATLTVPAHAATLISELAGDSYINFYSFEADINQLEANGGTYFGYVGTPATLQDKRDTGDVYMFFVNEYTSLKAAADRINSQIKDLVKLVESNGINSNKGFIDLAGDYVALDANGDVAIMVNGVNIATRDYVSANGNTYKQDTKTIDTDGDGTPDQYPHADKYVAVNKLYTKQDDIEAYVTSVGDSTIFAFLYNHPEFEELLNLDDFNAAKKTMDERMVELFAKAEQFVEEVDAIEYVRFDKTTGIGTTPYTTVIYEDANKNGKYDTDEEYEDADNTKPMIPQIVAGTNYEFVVSLEDSTDVNAAFSTYTNWTTKGGNLNQAVFANYVDSYELEEADVYYMKDLGELKVAVQEATATVHALRDNISDLKNVAQNFIKTVNNVKAVDAQTAIVVNFTSGVNTLDGLASNGFNRLAYTSFKQSTHENANSFDGTYGIIKLNGYETGTFNTANDGFQNESNTQSELAAQTITKKALLDKAEDYYKGFYDKHVEYIADADNDYTPNSGRKVYYQRTDYVPYAEFDAKVTEYTSYDVLSVKGVLYQKTLANYNDPYVREFRSMINAATTLSEIENIIVTYNTVDGFVSAQGKILNSDLDEYAVYTFDRLISLGY